jgi:DNA-binding MarR family transcriptional regulator
MAKIDVAQLWSLNYRLVSSIITSVGPDIEKLGLEVKELFVLAALDEYPHPAALAAQLCMPRPSVTFYLKHVESAGFTKRAVDPSDLRRHLITLTPAGRKVMARGMSLLSEAFGERLEKLSATEQSEFQRLLEKMS